MNKCIVSTELNEIITSYEYEKGTALPSQSNIITKNSKYYRVLNLNFDYDLGLIIIIVEPWIVK